MVLFSLTPRLLFYMGRSLGTRLALFTTSLIQRWKSPLLLCIVVNVNGKNKNGGGLAIVTKYGKVKMREAWPGLVPMLSTMSISTE